MTLPVAHAGHWLSSLIYVVPVAVLVGLLLLDRVRNRGRDPEGEESGDGGPGDPEPAREPDEPAPPPAAAP